MVVKAVLGVENPSQNVLRHQAMRTNSISFVLAVIGTLVTHLSAYSKEMSKLARSEPYTFPMDMKDCEGKYMTDTWSETT